SPDEAFRKIEAAIESAKTLKVEFTLDSAAKDAVPSKGSLSIEGNTKIRMTAELKSKDKPSAQLEIVSDGKAVTSTLGQSNVAIPFEPKFTRGNFNMFLSRLGLLAGSLFQHGFASGSARGPEPVSLDLKQMFQVQNLRAAGEGKNGTRILTYDLKAAFQPMPLDGAKLWYDPKTYKIVRREYRIKNKDFSELITEDYDEVRLGDEKTAPAPIPDAELENLFFKAKLDVAGIHLKAGKKD